MKKVPPRPPSLPRVVVIDTSDSPRSRSRAGADVVVARLCERGAAVTRIDASCWPPASQHESSPEIARAAKLVAAADGVVLGGATHDWAPAAAALNALIAILDGEGRPFRPFAFIGGAGGHRAQLAWDIAHRMVTMEANALVVGRTVMVVGDDLDESTRQVTTAVAARIRQTADALFLHACAFKSAAARAEAA